MRAAPLIVLLAAALAATPALSLEKTTARVIDRGEDWNTSTSATLRYYNNCTGWVWVWSNWSPGEQLGVNFDVATVGCGPFLNTTWALTFSGVPSGYGFTGTISTLGGTNCSSPVVASQAYLPPVTSGWAATAWGGLPIPQQFSVSITWAAASGFTNPTGLASDHPLAGPTGPSACGTCFPTSRMSSSRYYGVGGAYCPSGTTLNDGMCDIEWMIEAQFKCIPDISVEQRSWGKIKDLYR